MTDLKRNPSVRGVRNVPMIYISTFVGTNIYLDPFIKTAGPPQGRSR